MAPPSFEAPPSFDAAPSFEPAAQAETPAYEPPAAPASPALGSFDGPPSLDGVGGDLGVPALEAPVVGPPSLEATSSELPGTERPEAAVPVPPSFDGPPSPPSFDGPPSPPSFDGPPSPPSFDGPPSLDTPAAPLGAPAAAAPVVSEPPFTGGVDDSWGPMTLSPSNSADPAGIPPLVGGGAAGGDIRSMTPPVQEGGVAGSELLPSLDGFDTTFGPGSDLPDNFQRAHENVAQQTTEAPVAHNPYQSPTTSVVSQNRAGFGIRLLAQVIDAIWIFGLSFAVSLLVQDPIILAGVSLIPILIILVGWSVWGTTPGKRVLGLYVCNAEGKPGIGPLWAIVRYIGYFISLIPLGIGFLMALGKDRLTLHDRIAKTSVRRL